MGNNRKIPKVKSVTKSKHGVQVTFSDGTGYWSERPDTVNVDEVIAIAKSNVGKAMRNHGQTSNTQRRLQQVRKKK